MSSTRDNLLDAAERLFADHGFEAASMREITSLAHANLGSVNYHFGNKDSLLQEVLMRRIKRIVDERNRMLQIAVEAAGDSPPTVRSLMDAFISPGVHIASIHPHFAKLLARVQFEGMFQRVGEIFKQTFHESLSQFVKQLSRALPKLEPEEIQLRLMFSVGSFTFVAMNSKTICVGMKLPSVEQDPGVLTSRIVAFCTAGMEAPPARKPRARRKGSHQ